MLELKLSSATFNVTISLYTHITIISGNSGIGKTRLYNDIAGSKRLGILLSNVPLNNLHLYTNNDMSDTDIITSICKLTKDDVVFFDEATELITSDNERRLRNCAATLILVYRGNAFNEKSGYERLGLVYDTETHTYTVTHTLINELLN